MTEWNASCSRANRIIQAEKLLIFARMHRTSYPTLRWCFRMNRVVNFDQTSAFTWSWWYQFPHRRTLTSHWFKDFEKAVFILPILRVDWKTCIWSALKKRFVDLFGGEAPEYVYAYVAQIYEYQLGTKLRQTSQSGKTLFFFLFQNCFEHGGHSMHTPGKWSPELQRTHGERWRRRRALRQDGWGAEGEIWRNGVFVLQSFKQMLPLLN